MQPSLHLTGYRPTGHRQLCSSEMVARPSARSDPMATLSPRHVTRRTVWTRHNDNISVRILHPTFPVVRAAAPVRRITVARHHDRRVKLLDSRHALVKVVDLEPQQQSISIGPIVTIRNRTMVMLDF